MSPILLAAALYLMGHKKSGGGAPTALHSAAATHARRAKTKWPTVKHPPPRKLGIPDMPPMPAMPHEKAHDNPAEEAKASDHSADVHKPSVVTHHADATSHATAPTAVHHDASAPVEQHAKPHVTTLPIQHIRIPLFKSSPRAAKPAPVSVARGDVSIEQTQKILRDLGWKGHLTTKGPVSRDLTDGLYGPTTHDDWVQSANKRGLDPRFDRLGPKSVRVNPDTLAALKRVTGVSGIYIP